jgi:diguanylate cyclase (GGDEF)-like protein
MAENKLLTIADFISIEHLRKVVPLLHPTTLLITSNTIPKNEDLAQATLILIISCENNIGDILHQNAIAASTPILVLCDNESILPRDVEKHKKRLLDVVLLPISIRMFQLRLNFLYQIGRLSAEHHANSIIVSRQLDVLATRDGLTGLYNRRHLTQTLPLVLEKAKTNGEELSLLLLNIDFFNTVNKISGQQYGDFILNEIAARLTKASQKNDSCFRFSGEDFIVLMQETSLEEAKKNTEKIRHVCSEKPFTLGSISQYITISMGLASLQPHNPTSYDDFLNMTETALFIAKARGRNRLQVYNPLNSPGQFTARKSMTFLKDSLQRIMEKTRKSAIASVQLLAKNVAGPESQAHATVVSQYISLFGQKLGLSEQHLETFHNATALCSSFRSLLHNDLISKPQHLSEKERKVINDLPFKLTELTNMFNYFEKEREVLICHSERFDGTGHPRGLKGEEIPLAARIFTLIDAVAAMNAERPHRSKLRAEEIIHELLENAGKQFDPALVAQFLAVMKNSTLFAFDDNIIKEAHKNLLANFPEIRHDN